jgi:hypothetical protein
MPQEDFSKATTEELEVYEELLNKKKLEKLMKGIGAPPVPTPPIPRGLQQPKGPEDLSDTPIMSPTGGLMPPGASDMRDPRILPIMAGMGSAALTGGTGAALMGALPGLIGNPKEATGSALGQAAFNLIPGIGKFISKAPFWSGVTEGAASTIGGKAAEGEAPGVSDALLSLIPGVTNKYGAKIAKAGESSATNIRNLVNRMVGKPGAVDPDTLVSNVGGLAKPIEALEASEGAQLGINTAKELKTGALAKVYSQGHPKEEAKKAYAAARKISQGEEAKRTATITNTQDAITSRKTEIASLKNDLSKLPKTAVPEGDPRISAYEPQQKALDTQKTSIQDRINKLEQQNIEANNALKQFTKVESPSYIKAKEAEKAALKTFNESSSELAKAEGKLKMASANFNKLAEQDYQRHKLMQEALKYQGVDVRNLTPQSRNFLKKVAIQKPEDFITSIQKGEITRTDIDTLKKVFGEGSAELSTVRNAAAKKLLDEVAAVGPQGVEAGSLIKHLEKVDPESINALFNNPEAKDTLVRLGKLISAHQEDYRKLSIREYFHPARWILGLGLAISHPTSIGGTRLLPLNKIVDSILSAKSGPGKALANQVLNIMEDPTKGSAGTSIARAAQAWLNKNTEPLPNQQQTPMTQVAPQ